MWHNDYRTVRGVVALLLAAGLALFACTSSTDDDDDDNNNQPTELTCAQHCDRIMAAACANGPSSKADCEQGCSDTSAACPTEFAAAQSCAGSNPSYVCDANGMATISGCEAKVEVMFTCANKPLTCAESCAFTVAAKCANGPSDQASCETGCNGAKDQCPSQFDAYNACGGRTPTVICDNNGMPVASGCETEAAALFACLGL